jgi:hypothetical protein
MAEALALPEEIITEILGHMSYNDILKRCCLVSQTWNAAASSELLWKALCARLFEASELIGDSTTWKDSFVLLGTPNHSSY